MPKAKELMHGVYEIQGQIATKNLVKGKKVYGEQLLTINGDEYRYWNPNRSKVAAAIKKGLKEIGIVKKSKVLYLGAAEGTTISHLSDIVEKDGVVFGLDISARSMRKFIYLCEQRPNIIPILADASQPMSFKEQTAGLKMDAIFQDVSQREQAQIFLKNSRAYLKPKGQGFLTIKARSINSSESVEKIIEKEAEHLKKEFIIKKIISLHPYEKEHAMIHCQKK